MEWCYDGILGDVSVIAMIGAATLSWGAMDADRTATGLEPMLYEYSLTRADVRPAPVQMSSRDVDPLPSHVVRGLGEYLVARDDERMLDLWTGVALAVSLASGLGAISDRKLAHEVLRAAARDAGYFGLTSAESYLSGQAQRFEPE